MSYNRAVRGRVIEQRGNLASTGVFPRENDEEHLPHREIARPEEVPINCLAQSPFTKAKICVRSWCISLSLGSSFLERKNSVDTHSFSGSCWFLFVCFSKANTAKRDRSRLSQRKKGSLVGSNVVDARVILQVFMRWVTYYNKTWVFLQQEYQILQCQ